VFAVNGTDITTREALETAIVVGYDDCTRGSDRNGTGVFRVARKPPSPVLINYNGVVEGVNYFQRQSLDRLVRNRLNRLIVHFDQGLPGFLEFSQ
jgi:hypothetical protein